MESAGASPARGTCPVSTVAISGDGTGDQFIGSPEVKVPVGRAVENRRASEWSGHGIHWREGGNKVTYLLKETWVRHRTRGTVSTQIDRISELAKEDAKRQFYSIGHIITPEALYAAFRGLRKKTSAGMDGVTYQKYAKDAARKIQQLH